MTPAESLAEMRRRGMTVSLDGGRLRWSAPPGVATERTAAYLAAHGAELVALLEAEEAAVVAKRAASRQWAEEWAARRQATDGRFDTVSCFACGTERNAEVTPCPRCAPSQSLPAGCRSPLACSVLGPCAAGCVEVSPPAAAVADIAPKG